MIARRHAVGMMAKQLYHQSMHLGQEILDKVSDLIVGIERQKSPKRKKNPNMTAKRYEVEEGARFQQLHNNHRRGIERVQEREKQKIYNEIAHVHNFKVENKHTLFLNSRNPTRPIHERTQDILNQREISIGKKRAEYEREKRRKALEAENEENEQTMPRSKSAKRVSQKEVDEIVQNLTERQRERMARHNEEKMEYLKEKIKNNTGKPTISKQSQRIWANKQREKSLSPNVFERFARYGEDQRKAKEAYLQQIIEQETPFHPKISKYSEELVKTVRNERPGLMEGLSHTTSCKCFKKQPSHEALNKSGVARTSRKRAQSRRKETEDIKTQRSLHEASSMRQLSKTKLVIDPNC